VIRSTCTQINAGLSLVLILLFLLSACTPEIAETNAPLVIEGDVALAASAQAVATEFLTAWVTEDYEEMYEKLSSLSRDAVSMEAFESQYREVASTLTLDGLTFTLLSALADGNHAQIAYRVDFTTTLAGDISRAMVMHLTREAGKWWIQWETGLILPELQNGNRLEFVHSIPSRGRIFDREGAPMAAYENAIALGLVPGEILPEQAEQIYAILSEISVYSPESLARLVESTPADWYLPVISLSQAAAAPYMEQLEGMSGVRIDAFRSRFYVDGGVAPHVLGYMLFIPEEALEQYLQMGYRQDERIGAAGLEAAFEKELSGKRGGSLYVIGPDGKILSNLASIQSEPGQSVYTTLDKTLQMRLQESLGDLRAAVVVMEADSGRVLAMASNRNLGIIDTGASRLGDIPRCLRNINSRSGTQTEPQSHLGERTFKPFRKQRLANPIEPGITGTH